MIISDDDLIRLASEVNHFLGKADLATRLSTKARLYFEFADVGAMYGAHAAIMRAISPRLIPTQTEPYRAIDSETIEIEVASVLITLTCKKRFVHPDGKLRRPKSYGYSELYFKKGPSFEDEE